MVKKMYHLKRRVAVIVAVTLLVGCLPGHLQEKLGGQPQVKAETTLQNPGIVTDSSMTAGQKVTYSCIWFGSYPQTEIVDQESTSGTYGRLWAQQSDYEVNASLYVTLQSDSGWDSRGDRVVDGVKYHRIKQSDATYATSEYSDYYNWGESNNYRYFRYDKIKWRVLNISGRKAFLLADKILDDQRYNTEFTDVTWATSTIRSWLNGYGSESNAYGTDYSTSSFIGNAFFSAEQRAILNSKVVNSNSIYYNISGGKDTYDKLFLLSEAETYTDAANKYGFVSDEFTFDEARRSKSSTYAKAMGTRATTENMYCGNCDWWLRSPGDGANAAAAATEYGHIYTAGPYVYVSDRGVRPALYLSTSSSNLWSYAGTVCSDGREDQIGGELTLDEKTVNNVIQSIKDLSTDSDKEAVKAAREAYTSLTEDQKALIGYDGYDDLTTLESLLLEAEKRIVNSVIQMINELSTDSDKEAVKAAREAYNSLTENQKALISTEEMATLESLLSEAEKRITNKQVVNDVIQLINELSTESDEEAVKAAREAYDSLKEDQKALISTEELNTLESLLLEAEKRIEDKKKDAQEKPATTQSPKDPSTPAKKANSIKVTVKALKLKAKTLKRKKMVIKRTKVFKVKKAKGKVTYRKVKGSAKIKIAKNGKITIKKGLKKGKYKVKVTVRAAGNSKYNPGVKTVTVKIRVR